jgi:uncharacterized protein
MDASLRKHPGKTSRSAKNFPAMATKFHELTRTEAVRRSQAHYHGTSPPAQATVPRDQLTGEEKSFIARCDSFYLATVNADGWPYLQHRGGRPGFLHVVRPDQLAFADYRGNRQLLSTGNLAGNDKAALFLMDYPQRQRLKILGRARTVDARGHSDLVTQLAEPEQRHLVERLFFVDVDAYDWNCPQYITPRFTSGEIREMVAPLQKRVAELEAELAARQTK